MYLRIQRAKAANGKTENKDSTAQFIKFAIQCKVLRFGEFKTKAGRLSPYFFNAGLFYDGESLAKLGDFYAEAIIKSDVKFDMLFGPAYKGITLVAAVSMALAKRGKNVNFAYNRKEAKDHGEGGKIVGAPLEGKVLIIDDVISAGTSVRESLDTIEYEGAEPVGVVVALDRQERGEGIQSAVQEVEHDYLIPVIKIATLSDLISYMQGAPELSEYNQAMEAYRDRYGTL